MNLADYSDDQLTHYGVLGMKWGIKRGNAKGAYNKGVKKLKSLDKKASNYRVKGDKLAYKSSKLHATGKNDEKAQTLEVKSRQLKYKSSMFEQKGKKFYKKMEKVFKEVAVKDLNSSDVDYGKKYANRVLS